MRWAAATERTRAHETSCRATAWDSPVSPGQNDYQRQVVGSDIAFRVALLRDRTSDLKDSPFSRRRGLEECFFKLVPPRRQRHHVVRFSLANHRVGYESVASLTKSTGSTGIQGPCNCCVPNR